MLLLDSNEMKQKTKNTPEEEEEEELTSAKY